MESQTRALPESDLEAIFGVIVVVHGELLAGALPAELTQRLARRLTRHGPLAEGASAGEMNALLADVCQRLHWAMGDHDDEYPQAMPRQTTYSLLLPDEAAARSCATALIGQGGTDIGTQRHDETGVEVRVTFPDLAPDPAYTDRETDLAALAEAHGGRYSGAQM